MRLVKQLAKAREDASEAARGKHRASGRWDWRRCGQLPRVVAREAGGAISRAIGAAGRTLALAIRGISTAVLEAPGLIRVTRNSTTTRSTDPA